MAWELALGCIGNLVADSSMASNQYKIVKMSTTNNTFSLCSVDGEVPLGILQDDPASGDAGSIMVLGVSKVVAAETLTAGDFYGTGASGTAKIIEGTVTGADVGDMVLGQVLVGAAAGEYATVTVGIQTFRVEAQ